MLAQAIVCQIVDWIKTQRCLRLNKVEREMRMGLDWVTKGVDYEGHDHCIVELQWTWSGHCRLNCSTSIQFPLHWCVPEKQRLKSLQHLTSPSQPGWGTLTHILVGRRKVQIIFLLVCLKQRRCVKRQSWQWQGNLGITSFVEAKRQLCSWQGQQAQQWWR